MPNSANENTDVVIPHVELQVSNSAFGRRIREFDLVNKGYKKIEEFWVNAFEIYQDKLTEAVAEFDLIKTVSVFSAEFERSFHVEGENDVLMEKRDIHIPTKKCEIDTTTDLREHFENDIINHVVKQVDEVMIEGSGFTLSRIDQLRVQ